jgi:hypothetical protein
VGVSVGIGIVVFAWVGVIVGVDDGMGIVVALPHPTKPGKSNNESNKMLASKMKFFLFISISFYGLIPPNDLRFSRVARLLTVSILLVNIEAPFESFLPRLDTPAASAGWAGEFNLFDDFLAFILPNHKNY